METSTITKAAAKTYNQNEVDSLVIEALRAKANTPYHIHRCPDGHEWACNSPYCEDVAAVPRQCMDHGGDRPIQKGLEPWRGK